MVHPPATTSACWPTAPTDEEWARMGPDERIRAVAELESMELPEELRETMAEGDFHLDAKMDVRDTLRAFFGKIGRRIYVGAELAVFYPGQRVFSPDILAVREVDPKRRYSWFVSAEGKGLDLGLEVISRGDSKKDLAGNPVRYASLGIEEYFVLDLVRGIVLGYRLPEGPRPPTRLGVVKYERLVPQAGRLSSNVLHLDLALESGRLRFYQGTAELLTAADLAGKLERMVDELVVKHGEERVQREQAQAERERAEEQLRSAILAILGARGISLTDDHRARIAATRDALLLGRWIIRAATSADAADLFADH